MIIRMPARDRPGALGWRRGSHPVNAAFDQGCWRRRPRGSFAPIARAPSSLRTGISRKWKSTAPPAASPSARAGRAASRRPRAKCAEPESSATPRQGIKNTISPAGNVGKRARRRPATGGRQPQRSARHSGQRRSDRGLPGREASVPRTAPLPAAGVSLNLTTANPPTRRCTKPAFPATRLPNPVTWSSTVTHLKGCDFPV